METKRHIRATVTKGEDGKLAVAVGSDESVDRYGEVIEASAWDLKNFLDNPVMLLIHDYWDLPVGKCDDTRVEDGRLLFSPNFAVEIYEKAKIVHDMYLGGYMSAFSVGFIGRRGEMRSVKENDKETNTVVEKRRWFWTDVELLEISCVPVPANPTALLEEKSLVAKRMEKVMNKATMTDMKPDRFSKVCEIACTEESCEKFMRELDSSVKEGPDEETPAEPDVPDEPAAEEPNPEESAGQEPGTGDAPEDDGEKKVESAATQSRGILTAEEVRRALVEADKAIGKALRQINRNAS